jgi:hypothetical protein
MPSSMKSPRATMPKWMKSSPRTNAAGQPAGQQEKQQVSLPGMGSGSSSTN